MRLILRVLPILVLVPFLASVASAQTSSVSHEGSLIELGNSNQSGWTSVDYSNNNSLKGTSSGAVLSTVVTREGRAQQATVATKPFDFIMDESRIKHIQEGLPDTTCKQRNVICVNYGIYAQSEQDFQNLYYQAKTYLETCYNEYRSWAEFGEMSDAVSHLPGDSTKYIAFREWLKSELYLNTKDPNWYCQCARTIMGTFQHMNSGLAVCKYLLQSGKCLGDTASLAKIYNDGRYDQHQAWIDTCILHNHDTVGFSYDTTLPSIHDLGLDILNGPNAAVARAEHANTGLFVSVHAIENPFHKTTAIEVELSETAYLNFAVYDLLGEVVQGTGAGTVYAPGEYRFDLALEHAPSGTYYARFSTPLGEIKTVKLTKE